MMKLEICVMGEKIEDVDSLAEAFSYLEHQYKGRDQESELV